MFEYIFFEPSLRDRFTDFLRGHAVAFETAAEDDLLVCVPDDIDDELSDALDVLYEQLLQQNAEMLEDTEDALVRNAAGVRVQLADGQPCMVRLDPELMSRLLACIGLEELRDMVQAIAAQVESPDDSPLCHLR